MIVLLFFKLLEWPKRKKVLFEDVMIIFLLFYAGKVTSLSICVQHVHN